MNITLIYLGRKGAGPIYSLRMTHALLDKNKILAIISKNSDNIEDWRNLSMNNSNLKLYEVQTYTAFFSFFFSFLRIQTFLKIREHIINFESDAVYSTMVHPWNFIIFSFLPKCLLSIRTLHDAKPHIGEDGFFMRFLLYQERKADYIIALTQTVSGQLQTLGVSEDKIRVIPHAIMNYHTESYTLTEFKLNYRIGFFGRINEYKGLKYLCDAFEIVFKELPNLRLLIAGQGNVAKQSAFFQKYDNSLDLHLRWIKDDEITNLIESVDIIVLPYIEASQSGVIPLAFSLGKPVVVTNVGGLSEQVPFGCGIIIPAKDVEELAASILNLYKNKYLVQNMGIAAKKHADTFLTWESSAEKLISLIQNR